MSDIQLKPCPYCQSDNVGVECSRGVADDGMIRHFYYGFCGDCHMAGHDVSNEEGEGIAEEQAAEEWNAMPRPLQWTSEPPTEPGWYWQRRDKEDTPLPVRVENVGDCPTAAQWAGPIHEPLEPK